MQAVECVCVNIEHEQGAKQKSDANHMLMPWMLPKDMNLKLIHSERWQKTSTDVEHDVDQLILQQWTLYEFEYIYYLSIWK